MGPASAGLFVPQLHLMCGILNLKSCHLFRGGVPLGANLTSNMGKRIRGNWPTIIMVIEKVLALRMLPQRFGSLIAGCVMAAFQNFSAEETIDLFNSEEFVHMLECLANLDQCSTEGEFDNRIPEILKALCNVSQADRAYVFEWDDEERATLSNTFEYCAPGVTPEIENLQCIPTEDMPIWVDALVAGKPMIISDLEAVANEMPREYAILKP